MKKLWIVLGTITAATLLLCIGAVVYAGHIKPIETPTIVHLNADIVFAKVNDERVKIGLKPLIRDSRLDQTAQERADDMFTRKYFSHYDPITGKGMIDNQDFQCTGGSENIGLALDMTGDNNKDAVDWWMNSKPHHDAILNPKYTLTGVAVHGGISVQHFCIAK